MICKSLGIVGNSWHYASPSDGNAPVTDLEIVGRVISRPRTNLHVLPKRTHAPALYRTEEKKSYQLRSFKDV